MNKHKLTHIAIIATLFGLSASLHAVKNKVVELDDFEVVGNYLQSNQLSSLKTATPIEEIPKSLTILTSDLIALKDLTSISAIADYVPGIIAGQGEGHRDDIIFRGQKSTADFFVDGVRDDVQYYRPLYNVEQIEVLKGSDALFFGRGGTGGLINRVSKTAQIGENFTNYTLSFDDLGESSIQIDKNMTIASNAALRFNYYHEDLENHRDYFYGNNYGFNPTLKVKLTDKTSLNLSYENLDHERFIDRGITTTGYNAVDTTGDNKEDKVLSNGDPVNSLAGITFADEDFNKSTLSANITKITLDHKLNDHTKVRFNYTNNSFNKLYQNWYASGESGTLVKMSGYKDTTQRESTIFSTDLIGEKSISNIMHKYVLGFETIDTTNNNDRVRPSGSNDVPFSSTNGLTQVGTMTNGDPMLPSNPKSDKSKASLEVKSIYFSDEITLSDELDLIIGGRLDDFNLTAAQYNPGTGNLLEDPAPSRRDKEFSSRLGLVYKPKSDLTLYASYSETFIPQSGEQYATLSDEKDKLVSDIYENSEVGAKFDLDNGISITASYYELTANKAKYVSDTEHTRYTDEYSGYEIQAMGNITDNWFISTSASFTDYADITGVIKTDVLEVPSRTFSIWNLYKYNDKLSFGLGIVDKGETIGKGYVNLPDYTRIDAAAYYKIDDNLRLQLNVENITDELYYPNSYGTHQVTVGAPMHATIKIVGKF